MAVPTQFLAEKKKVSKSEDNEKKDMWKMETVKVIEQVRAR